MSVTEEKQPSLSEQLPLDFIAEEIYSHYREDAIDMITMYLEHNPQSILYWDAWFRGASNEWLKENDFTGRVYHPDQDHKNGGRRSSTYFRLRNQGWEIVDADSDWEDATDSCPSGWVR